jgi:uncharacterized protein (TIGR02757 family)
MSLKHHLDTFLDNFPRERHLNNDPVRFVHRYDDPQDREIVGLIAAVFAYGNVKIVLKSVERALEYLGPRPSQTVAVFDPKRDLRRLRGFYHRFNTSRDLAVLFWIIRRTLEEHGSIEAAFGDADDMGVAIDGFGARMLGYGHEQFYPRGELEKRIGVRFFFPMPSQGSACKRTNLYLRWMVRPADGIDCGVWKRVKPSQLVIPLDTHIARISSYIGLTDLKSPGWSMAVDITRSLKRLHREDPLRYDFALCHMGIAGDCPRKRDPVKCQKCPIQAVCRL